MILTRICKSCGKAKRTTEFYKLRRDLTCKECWRAKARQRYVPKARREPAAKPPARPTILAALQAWCVRP